MNAHETEMARRIAEATYLVHEAIRTEDYSLIRKAFSLSTSEYPFFMEEDDEWIAIEDEIIPIPEGTF